MLSENSILTNPKIYDIPDMGNVTGAVMCKLTLISVVCVVFLCAEVLISIKN